MARIDISPAPSDSDCIFFLCFLMSKAVNVPSPLKSMDIGSVRTRLISRKVRRRRT